MFWNSRGQGVTPACLRIRKSVHVNYRPEFTTQRTLSRLQQRTKTASYAEYPPFTCRYVDCDYLRDFNSGSAAAAFNNWKRKRFAVPVFRQLGRGSASLPRAYRQLPRLRLLARRTQANTKAEAAEAGRRAEPIAVRRPAILGGAEPTAATEHAVRARCRPTRVRHSTTRIIAIPVLTPLPNITVHIV